MDYLDPNYHPPLNMQEQVQQGVLIYIEKSNTYIKTMHFRAKNLKFINDLQQYQRIRFNTQQ
jgi:hypothetical protein